MKFNFLSLHDKIRSRNDALKFAQEHELIKSSAQCKTCSRQFTVQHTQAKTNYVFFTCTQCHTKESIRRDTFLYNKVIWYLCIMHDWFYISILVYQYISNQYICMSLFLRIFPSSPSSCSASSSLRCPTWQSPTSLTRLNTAISLFFWSIFSWTWLSLTLKVAMSIWLMAMDCQTPLSSFIGIYFGQYISYICCVQNTTLYRVFFLTAPPLKS